MPKPCALWTNLHSPLVVRGAVLYNASYRHGALSMSQQSVWVEPASAYLQHVTTASEHVARANCHEARGLPIGTSTQNRVATCSSTPAAIAEHWAN